MALRKEVRRSHSVFVDEIYARLFAKSEFENFIASPKSIGIMSLSLTSMVYLSEAPCLLALHKSHGNLPMYSVFCYH
jgi:hypothetical protein